MSNGKSNGLGFGGACIVVFFIGVGLAMLGVHNWGIACMLLGGGFLAMLGAGKTGFPFNWILGGIGIAALIAAGFFFSFALKPSIQQTPQQTSRPLQLLAQSHTFNFSPF